MHGGPAGRSVVSLLALSDPITSRSLARSLRSNIGIHLSWPLELPGSRPGGYFWTCSSGLRISDIGTRRSGRPRYLRQLRITQNRARNEIEE